MTTDVSAIIAAICSISREFRRGHISPRDLVAKSGFKTVRNALTAGALETYLAFDPTLLDDWEGWSDDKRVSEGWYFCRLHGRGTVGYLLNDGHVFTMNYDSEVKACAQFILHEIRHIDRLGERERLREGGAGMGSGTSEGKDDSILAMLSVLNNTFGAMAFEITDNWDADTMALGIHRVDEPDRVVYISTFNQPRDRYFVSLEEPASVDIDLPDLDTAGLIAAVEKHLSLKRLA